MARSTDQQGINRQWPSYFFSRFCPTGLLCLMPPYIRPGNGALLRCGSLDINRMHAHFTGPDDTFGFKPVIDLPAWGLPLFSKIS